MNEKELRTRQPPPFIPLHDWARGYFNVSLENQDFDRFMPLNEEKGRKLKVKLTDFS